MHLSLPTVIAHRDGKREHSLFDHLQHTAEKASEFASSFCSADWGYLAGLWHDIGKFSEAFQKMIHASTMGEVDGPKAKVDHSTAGAVLARETFNDMGFPLAFAIAGHHAGLQDIQDLKGRLDRKREKLEEVKYGGAPNFFLKNDQTKELSPPDFFNSISEPGRYKLSYEFWVRMLYSALTDADFLDAENFFSELKATERGRSFHPPFGELWKKLEMHMQARQQIPPDSPVNRIRREIFKACVAAGNEAPGIFSLTAPTGGGKTLAAMGFALKHILRHNLRRIVVVLPFTTIIEQNAKVYKKIFGDDNVLEHHSNLAPEKETFWNQLASENWDAPIIVTTNVQFFESLLANRSSGCRKLHNIPGSVIIFDEVQAFPVHHLSTILDLLNELVERYKVTILLSTATQPALKERHSPDQKFHGLKSIKEIVPNSSSSFQQLKRAEVFWPKDSSVSDWKSLAKEIELHPRVLVIVNKRADARALAQLMPSDTFHLSTLMCAKHRFEILERVQGRLKSGESVRLVSTQLVEAGVDFDFPVVFRAIAGLDSIAQAAGRCNREGTSEAKGRMKVFIPPTPSPRGILRTAEELTKSMLKGNPAIDPLTPDVYDNYFRALYFTQPQDQAGIQKERESRNFRTVAEKFRMIDDAGRKALVVPYHGYEANLKKIKSSEAVGQNVLRALQPYIVELYGHEYEILEKRGALQLFGDTVWGLAAGFHHLYDIHSGMLIDGQVYQDPDSFIL